MEQLFNIDLKKISTNSKKEFDERKKNLNLFLESGLPNKKDEDWKFTDLNAIIKNNSKFFFLSAASLSFEEFILLKSMLNNCSIISNFHNLFSLVLDLIQHILF